MPDVTTTVTSPMRRLLCMLAVAAAALHAPSARADEAGTRALLERTKLSLPDAVSRARKAAPGAVPIRVALRPRGDAVLYDVRLLEGTREVKLEIDAVTGEIQPPSEPPASDERRRLFAQLGPLLATATVDPVKAAALAEARVPGARAVVVEPDIEDDALEFEVSMLGPDGLAKAEISAATGEITSLVGAKPTPPFDPAIHAFDHLRAGGPATGWTCEAPGVDAPPAWIVAADLKAASPPHVYTLATPASDPAARLLAWNPALRMQDGVAEAKLRLDRAGDAGAAGGGLLWRLRDALDHYSVGYDGAAKRLVLEVVRDGERKTLGAAPFVAEPGRWYVLGASHDGDRIVVFIDGQSRIAANDSALPAEGAVGVWSRGDARARFDDVRVVPPAPR